MEVFISHQRSIRIIGLTGGIATGKSAVASYINSNYNLPIFDADLYARDAVEIGSPVLSQIIEKYGQDILLSDGNLDRQKFGEIVFSDLAVRHWVEELIHPYVRDRFVYNLAHPTYQTSVFVIPLLFEAQMTELVTETWVVYCSEEQQLQRLMQRNSLTLQEAKRRISAQMPLSQKCELADIVLDNSTTLAALQCQIKRIFNN